MLPLNEDDFRMEQPNYTLDELTDRVKGALLDFVDELQVDLTAYKTWCQEISPQIAMYVALSAVDPARSKRELGIISAIAKAKAANLALTQTVNGQEAFGNYALLVARTLFRILI